MTVRVALSFALILAAAPLFAQAVQIHEHPCKEAVPNSRCGYIEVLEDRSKPNGRKIPIEFVQVRSSSKDRQPDAWIDVAGGPGITATMGYGEMFDVFKYVLKRRDIVLANQRGTSESSGLHCDVNQNAKPEDAANFLSIEGVKRCRAEIAPKADPAAYNTAAIVEDLDELRTALGYDKLTFHSLSYGTRVAQAYIQAHPEHVRAAVFEGALQPGARIPLAFMGAMQHALQGLLDDCIHELNCKPVGEAIDLKKLSGIKEFTVTTAGGELHVTPPQLFEMVRTLLYNGESARRVPLLLSALTHGDTRQLAAVNRIVHRDESNFSWPVWLSVTCAEDTPFITEQDIERASAGTLIGDYRIRLQQRACKEWPVPKRDPALGKPTEIPVLLMEGDADVATPPWPDDVFRRTFPNGRQVILPHVGHMPIGYDGIECLDNIEEQFLDTLNASKLDVTCREQVRRKPFIVEHK